MCLGHQAIGAAFGGKVIRAPKLFHGKTSQIHHDGKNIFRKLADPFTATRYHSLIVERKSLPRELAITAETDDGLSGKEGTFLICSFWLVSALCVIGENRRADELLERLLRTASPLGLYAEEYDVATGYHLGNFPQAFSHLALIEAAGRVILAERVQELT